MDAGSWNSWMLCPVPGLLCRLSSDSNELGEICYPGYYSLTHNWAGLSSWWSLRRWILNETYWRCMSLSCNLWCMINYSIDILIPPYQWLCVCRGKTESQFWTVACMCWTSSFPTPRWHPCSVFSSRSYWAGMLDWPYLCKENATSLYLKD